MNTIKIIFLILLIISSQSSFSNVDLSKVNFNYKYDPASEVLFNYKIAVSANVATIFLKLEYDRENVNNPDAFRLTYQIRKNYKDTTLVSQGTLGLSERINTEETFTHYYRFSIPVVKNETLLLFKLFNPISNKEYIFDVPVDQPLQFPHTSLLIMEKGRDIPIFREYVHSRDSIRIVSIGNEVSDAFFYYYSKSFTAADPPMAVRPVVVDKEMRIDSSARVSVNNITNLSKPGLYFFQQDTASLQGFSVLVTDQFYPQFVKAETLVEPLIYISTAREMKKIRDNSEKKKALDSYWLELTKSPERAKKIIKDYYRQIELSNYLFTTYKEGWKTDQGMILALYGKPDAVFNNGEFEEWIYERRGSISRIKFTFTKVKNIFTNDHYELVRNQTYDREWYRTVDQWRKGRQEI